MRDETKCVSSRVFHLVCFIPCVSPRAFPPVLLSGGRVFHLVCFIPCVSPRVFHPVCFIPCLSSRVAVVMSIDLVQRREREHAMFSDTRQHLVQRGFPVESIRMLEGWDVRASGESCDAPNPTNVACGLSSTSFCLARFVVSRKPQLCGSYYGWKTMPD